MQKYTTETFIEKAREIHGDTYDYSLLEYKGIFDIVKIICPIHGVFEQVAHNHLNGNGCPICGRNKPSKKKNEKAKNEFFEKVNRIHGNKYDFSNSEYVNARDYMTVVCHEKDANGVEHGPFKIRPYNLLSGYGCKKCATDKLSVERRMPFDEYQKKINEKYGNGLYSINEESYNSLTNSVECLCNKHNKKFYVNKRNFSYYRCYCCEDCIREIKSFTGVNITQIQNSNDEFIHPTLDSNLIEKIKNGEEVWVPVFGHENEYIVSSNGVVKKINRLSRAGKKLPDYILTQHTCNGKRRASVRLGGKDRSVHKIVFESFYKVKVEKGYSQTIDHIDTNPFNNNVLNLRLCNGISDNMNNELTKLHLSEGSKGHSGKMIFDFEDLEGEIWVDCIGYDGLYSVSNFGRVRANERMLVEKNTGNIRRKKPHLMHLHEKDNQYFTIGLINKNGIHKNHYVHKLEYESFNGLIKEGNQVDHIDSNPFNNELSNLREVTPKENMNNKNSIEKRLKNRKQISKYESDELCIEICKKVKNRKELSDKYNGCFSWMKKHKEALLDKLLPKKRYKNENKKLPVETQLSLNFD